MTVCWRSSRGSSRPIPSWSRSRSSGHAPRDRRRPRSDIDIATTGIRDRRTLDQLVLDLEDLDVPQKVDAKALENIRYAPLIRHIEAVGIMIYQRPVP